jgi:monoamine oxidase
MRAAMARHSWPCVRWICWPSLPPNPPLCRWRRMHARLLPRARRANGGRVNTSRSALLQSDRTFSGRPLEQREIVNDARGRIAELLAKAIRQGALDEEITGEDRERMLAFLQNFGDLRYDYVYAGSSRASVKRLPGAETEEELREPLPLHALLQASFWRGVAFEEGFDQQATMFQPIGGMDRIPYAFAKSLGKIVKYKSPVREIRKTPNGFE